MSRRVNRLSACPTPPSLPGSCARASTSRWPGRSPSWIGDNGLAAGDRLPPERELAQRLGVSRATLSQALVALEVIGVVEVRHGDGTVVTGAPRVDPHRRGDPQPRRPAARDHRDARRPRDQDRGAGRRRAAPTTTRPDRRRAGRMAADIDADGRGVEGDERFHGAVTAAPHSLLLARLMDEIGDLSGRPGSSRSASRRPAGLARRPPRDRRGDPRRRPCRCGRGLHAHVAMVSDVALLRERP